MYQRRPDIIAGQNYNRLTAVEKVKQGKRGQTRWLFRCECGNMRTIDAIDVKKGKTKSCGCLQPENAIKTHTQHGLCGTKLYSVHEDMKQRCYNPHEKSYKNYGGRGITICDEWRYSPQAFYEWAINNGYYESLSIERINNNKGYSPDNCRWATTAEQARNKRSNIFITIKGVTKILADWASEIGVNQRSVATRIRNGWDPIDALKEPYHAWNPKRKKAAK